MTQSRYLLKYLGDNKQELSLILELIAKDKSMKLRNGKWNISDKTVAAVLEKFDESLFSLEKLDSLGTELNDGFALYPYQEDIVKFCIDRNSALVAAGCGCGTCASAFGPASGFVCGLATSATEGCCGKVADSRTVK